MGQSPERRISIVSALTVAEHITLYEWGADLFGSEHLHLEWRPKDWHALCYEGTQLVSVTGVLKHEVLVKNRPVTVGGVGGVVTVPGAQRHGHATALLRCAAGFIHEELAARFGMLFCREAMVPFYERLGWVVVLDRVLIDQPSGSIQSPLAVMTLSCQKEHWPEGEVKLCSQPW